MVGVASLDDGVIYCFEIDVVFPGDHGFLQALQDIISSTKCPVVLTCSGKILLLAKAGNIFPCRPSSGSSG